jgi:hypothetical protein
MSRPRCDPVDTRAALSALEARAVGLTGESRDPAVLRQLYADYASVAARPYARATWEGLLRAAQRKAVSGIETAEIGPHANNSRMNGLPSASDAEWLSPVKPANILTLSSDAPMLYVRGDSLVCRDDDLILKYERRSHKPCAIVLTGWGGRITIGRSAFAPITT